MPDPQEIAAFFDVEGTLFDGNIWRTIVNHHRAHGVGRNAVRLYLGVHVPVWYAYRAGLISRERAMTAWARDIAWLMRGWPVERAGAAFDWIVEHEILPVARPATLDALRAHQQQEHRTVLISGGPEPLIQALAARLDVRHAIGTRWAVHNSRYTGHIVPPLCMGQGKAARFDEFLADDLSPFPSPDRNGVSRAIDLRASYAYGDTLADVPMLERVGHPVATYPQPALAVLARERGWKVIGEES
jgi:HAD superfamily hydrolase (TIGR01490 family)